MSMLKHGLLATILVLGPTGGALADGDGSPPRRGERMIMDRDESVIRTPDNSDVPADLYPRQPNNFQITVDPYAARRRIDDAPRMPAQRPDFDRR